MSAGPNPYSSPMGQSPLSNPPPVGVPVHRPGWMTAICILAIILGALGLMMALFGSVALAFGERFQQMVQGMSTVGQPPGMKEVQLEMQKAMQAVQDRWFVAIALQYALHFVLAFALILGAAKSLQMDSFGRRLLAGALFAAIAFELLRLIPTMAIQMGTMDVMQEYMQHIMQASAPPGKAMPQQAQIAMATMMKGSMAVGIAFTLVFVVAKIAFYTAAGIYMNKPHIRYGAALPYFTSVSEPSRTMPMPGA